MGTELAEARARVSELEESTTAHKKRSESAIAESGKTESLSYEQNGDGDREAKYVAEITRQLREQKSESMQATIKAYEMEQLLTQAQTR